MSGLVLAVLLLLFVGTAGALVMLVVWLLAGAGPTALAVVVVDSYLRRHPHGYDVVVVLPEWADEVSSSDAALP